MNRRREGCWVLRGAEGEDCAIAAKVSACVFLLLYACTHVRLCVCLCWCDSDNSR